MSLSLKWQIQFWYASILLILLITLGVGFYRYEKALKIAAVDEQLARFAPIILGPGGARGFPQNKIPPALDANVSGDVQITIPEGWTKRRPGSAFAMSNIPEYPRRSSGDAYTFFNEQIVPLGFYARMEFFIGYREDFTSEGFPDIEIPHARHTGQLSRTREMRYREFFNETPSLRMLIGYDMEKLSDDFNLLKCQIAGAIVALFSLAMMVGYFLVSRSVFPLKRITKTTQAIASAQLDARVPEPRSNDASELKTLTTDLNHAFSQLEILFERQKRFTADASHELRTPLATLLSQIEHGLKRPRTVEEHTAILEVCERSTDRIRRIIDQLLELARYDTGSAQVNCQVVNGQAMLQALAEELTPSVEKNGSELQTDLIECEVDCDPFLVEQVVINFVNNALEHNTDPVTIQIRLRKENDQAIIQVADNGKGISPENIERLFDRFFQEDQSRTQKNVRPNVGLGLSISQAIAKAHGSSIQVRSQPQVETVFEIRIPIIPQ